MINALALLALLCLVLPSAAQAVGDETLRANRDRLAVTAQAVKEFKTINGGYPSSLDELEPSLYQVHPDSAGRPPVYKLADDGTSFELSFLGPDGLEDTDDDIRYEIGGRAIRRTTARHVIPWLKNRARGF